MQTISPKPLKDNSTIGLICPAGGVDDYKVVHKAKKYLTALGFKVKVGKHLLNSKKFYKYLSGTDLERLSDLNNFLYDDKIDAIFCMRGGYGCTRLLPFLDDIKIKKTSKIIIGYSDITALLLLLYKQTGLITFHGPMLGNKFFSTRKKNKSNEQNMWQLLKKKDFSFSYTAKGKTIYPGKVNGKLLGGNLTVICSMLGTDLLPDFSNSILFLEDCNEEPYKIDRLLTQLDNAKIFSKVKGILFASFLNCKFKNNNTLINLLSERTRKYKIPTAYGFPIGHGNKNYTVPIGANVVFDSSKITLRSEK